MLDSTPYMMGDSAQDGERKSAFGAFSDQLSAFAEGRQFPFTVVKLARGEGKAFGVRGVERGQRWHACVCAGTCTCAIKWAHA